MSKSHTVGFRSVLDVWHKLHMNKSGREISGTAKSGQMERPGLARVDETRRLSAPETHNQLPHGPGVSPPALGPLFCLVESN
jgi:hypothetical protein